MIRNIRYTFFTQRAQRKKRHAEVAKGYLHNLSPQIKWLILIYILTLPLLQPWVNSDGIAYYSQLRSIVIDHDLQFENEFRHYQEEFRNKKSTTLQRLQGVSDYTPAYDESGLFSPDEPKTVTGHTPNRFSVGPALLWLPFFLLGHSIALVLQALGRENIADGYSIYYVLPVCLGTTIYGFLGLLLSYKIANIFVSPKMSFVSTLIIWFASPLIYYMYLVPTLSHTLAVFTVALFIYCWIHWRNQLNTPRALVLGFLLGIVALVRWQNALLGIFLLGDILLLKLPLKYLFFYSLAFILGFMPQMAVWKVVYGNYLLVPTGGESLHWTHPMFLEVLFSTRHGFFTWNPIFLFSFLGLYYFYRMDSKVTFYFLLLFILEVYVNAAFENWWCGASFGYRRLLDYLPFYILGLAVFFEHAKKKTPVSILYLLGILFVVWNIGFMLQYALGMISHTQPVSLAVVAENLITRVPEKMGTIIHYILFKH